jgi:hypothetical protein
MEWKGSACLPVPRKRLCLQCVPLLLPCLALLQITIGLHRDELDMTLGCIRSGLQQAGAKAIIITSFHGEMRCVCLFFLSAVESNETGI